MALDELGQDACAGDDARAVQAFVDYGEKMLLPVVTQFDVWEGDSSYCSLQMIWIMSPDKPENQPSSKEIVDNTIKLTVY